jgi:hypothetical protein
MKKLPIIFVKVVLQVICCLYFNLAFSQNIKIYAGQSIDMTTYIFKNTSIDYDFPHIAMDSVGILGNPNFYDLKIRTISSGSAPAWLSYQLLQGAPVGSWPKMEIAVNSINQFSATVKRFEENEPVFEITSDYEWQKLDGIQMYLRQLSFNSPDTSSIGEWTDSTEHYLAFRYFNQLKTDTLYGYLKLKVNNQFLIAETDILQLAIQNDISGIDFLGNTDFQLQIFPNPVQDLMQFSTSEPLDFAQILNVNGQIMWSKASGFSEKTIIEMQQFPPAQYWLAAHSNGKKRVISFFVK